MTRTDHARVACLLATLALLSVAYAANTNSDDFRNFEGESNAIINGNDVPAIGHFPYIGLYRSDVGTAGVVTCTASLVAKNKVLFAAHCVKEAGSAEVCFGQTSYTLHSGAYCYSLTSEVQHPQYQTPGGGYDIAVGTLERDADFPGAVVLKLNVPGTPWFAETTDGLTAFALGVGVNHFGFNLRLRRARVPVILNGDCSALRKYGLEDDNKFLCAGGLVAGKPIGVCSGDSGGPLVLVGRTAADDVAIGVASFIVGTYLIFVQG